MTRELLVIRVIGYWQVYCKFVACQVNLGSITNLQFAIHALFIELTLFIITFPSLSLVLVLFCKKLDIFSYFAYN